MNTNKQTIELLDQLIINLKLLIDLWDKSVATLEVTNK